MAATARLRRCGPLPRECRRSAACHACAAKARTVETYRAEIAKLRAQISHSPRWQSARGWMLRSGVLMA